MTDEPKTGRLQADEVVGGVYAIVNKKNSRQYIGSSCDIYKRWWTHVHFLRLGKHINKHLQRAWNKYGEENFNFVILLRCAREDLLENEQNFLDNTSPKYNFCVTAGSLLGIKTTAKIRAKMSAAAKNRKPITEETRARVFAANKRKVTPEFRAKLSAAGMGHEVSAETRAKISVSLKKYTTPEVRARMSTRNKGQIISPETRIKMSATRRGMIRSPEACANMKIAQRKRRVNERKNPQKVEQ